MSKTDYQYLLRASTFINDKNDPRVHCQEPFDKDGLNVVCTYLLVSRALEQGEKAQELERYNNIHPLVFAKQTPPSNLCMLSCREVDVWKKQGTKDAAVFALVQNSYDWEWDIYLVGFVSRQRNNFFSNDKVMQENMAKLVNCDIEKCGSQYMFNRSELEHSLSRVQVACVETPKFKQTEEEDILSSSFGPFIVARSAKYFTERFGQGLEPALLAQNGTGDVINKKLEFYKTVVGLKQTMEPAKAYSVADTYIKTYSIHQEDIQRYILTVFMVAAVYNDSFKMYLIECEDYLCQFICAKFKGRHICQDPIKGGECELRLHTKAMQQVMDALDKSKNEIGVIKTFESIKTFVQTKIVNVLGKLSEIYQTHIKTERDLDDYIIV